MHLFVLSIPRQKQRQIFSSTHLFQPQAVNALCVPPPPPPPPLCEPKVPLGSFTSEDDSLVLEDESGRVSLSGPGIQCQSLVSGVSFVFFVLFLLLFASTSASFLPEFCPPVSRMRLSRCCPPAALLLRTCQSRTEAWISMYPGPQPDPQLCAVSGVVHGKIWS